MSWKSPGFHWNPLKDLKRFSLHISRFLFTPSLLFTYILCTMQHMLGPIMTMRIILSHVKTRGMAGGRSVGVAFFQPPSNIIQTHSNVIQNLKPQKISVKKVCLLFPTEILLNALAQNWHRCGFPCGIGFLCGRSWVWEPTAPFCIRRSSKDGLVMNMNIIEYPSPWLPSSKTMNMLEMQKSLRPWLLIFLFWIMINFCDPVILEIHPVLYIWQQLNAVRQQQPKVRESGFLPAGHSRRCWSGSSWVTHYCCSH